MVRSTLFEDSQAGATKLKKKSGLKQYCSVYGETSQNKRGWDFRPIQIYAKVHLRLEYSIKFVVYC